MTWKIDGAPWALKLGLSQDGLADTGAKERANVLDKPSLIEHLPSYLLFVIHDCAGQFTVILLIQGMLDYHEETACTDTRPVTK